ncbi:MAG TPA: hypothetical protein VES38_01660 [Methylotenera sp.]|nr:hypothetical protein [Methylotenera sp.]
MKSRTDLIREANVKRGIQMARDQGYLAATGMMMKAGLSYTTIIRVLYSASRRHTDLDM